MIRKMFIVLFMVLFIIACTVESQQPADFRTKIVSVDTDLEQEAGWYIVPKGVTSMTIQAEAEHADTMLFWIAPTGTETGKEMELIGYDLDSSDGWSFTWEFGERRFHDHMFVQALGIDGISQDRAIFNVHSSEESLRIPLAATEDQTASVTGLDQTGGMIGPMDVAFHGKTKTFDWMNSSNPTYFPEVFLSDLDADGKEELAIVLTTGHGTGVRESEIHVLRDDLQEIPVQPPLGRAEAEVSSSFVKKGQAIVYTVKVAGEEYHYLYREKDAGMWFEGAVVGNSTVYRVEENQLAASLSVQVSPGMVLGTVDVYYHYQDGEFVPSHVEPALEHYMARIVSLHFEPFPDVQTVEPIGGLEDANIIMEQEAGNGTIIIYEKREDSEHLYGAYQTKNTLYSLGVVGSPSVWLDDEPVSIDELELNHQTILRITGLLGANAPLQNYFVVEEERIAPYLRIDTGNSTEADLDGDGATEFISSHGTSIQSYLYRWADGQMVVADINETLKAQSVYLDKNNRFQAQFAGNDAPVEWMYCLGELIEIPKGNSSEPISGERNQKILEFDMKLKELEELAEQLEQRQQP